MNTLFPVFLKLESLHVLLVGGGNVGLEKLEALLRNAPLANVTVVAPYIKPEIEALAQTHPGVRLEQRMFITSDLEQKHFIICATDRPELHASICRIAHDMHILVNVADTPELCDVYLSSIVQKGDLKIAISTNGKSPTFAKRLKELLNETLEADTINQLLENLNKYRDSLKGNFNEKVKAMDALTKQLLKK